MANALEIQVMQKERLFDLLLLKKVNPDVKIIGLNRLITKTKAGMSAEDISHVEKLVEQEDDF